MEPSDEESVLALLASQPLGGQILMPCLQRICLPSRFQDRMGRLRSALPSRYLSVPNSIIAELKNIIFEEDTNTEHPERLWAAEAAEC